MLDLTGWKRDHPQVAILGIPFDDHSSFLKGAALAPPLIREAFYTYASNSWTENGIELSKQALVLNVGDMEGTQQEIFQSIQDSVSSLLELDLFPICLGGDHSITFPILQAFRKKYNRLGVLHFDAHPDLYDELDGNRLSHASPFARVMENRLVDRLVQIGIRTLNQHQREQAERFGVEIEEMKNWEENRILAFDSPVYISFDVDGLDPAFAPGVSHPEAGGPSTRQVLHVIQNLKGRVVGADIVEFNPHKDVSGITAAACAKLLKEICGKILSM